MMMSKVSDAKKIGRPPTGVGTPVTVRLHRRQIDALDGWIRQQDPVPSRPEAIRRLLEERLGAEI